MSSRISDSRKVVFAMFKRRNHLKTRSHWTETLSILPCVGQKWGAKQSTSSERTQISQTEIQMCCVIQQFPCLCQIRFFNVWKNFLDESNCLRPNNNVIRHGEACIQDYKRFWNFHIFEMLTFTKIGGQSYFRKSSSISRTANQEFHKSIIEHKKIDS